MKKITMLALLLPIAGSVLAQDAKLQNIQTATGFKAPVVKVDGNLKEWDDSFQAYNKQTRLYYTISNDDQMLYLAVKSTDMQNSNKIAAGGITLTLNTEGKKKDKDAFVLTFPVIARQAGRGFGGPGGPGAPGANGQRGGFGPDGQRGFGDRNNKPDSATMAARHKQTIDAAKEIRLSGFKDITDSTISIYNEYSIKAAIGYDAAGNYGYELAIPLKLLNITPGDKKEIAYNIKVNGLTMPNFDRRRDDSGAPGGDRGGLGGDGGGRGGAGGGAPGGGGGFAGGAPGGGDRGPGGPGGPGGGNFAEMFSPTDFWGKYTLAQ